MIHKHRLKWRTIKKALFIILGCFIVLAGIIGAAAEPTCTSNTMTVCEGNLCKLLLTEERYFNKDCTTLDQAVSAGWNNGAYTITGLGHSITIQPYIHWQSTNQWLNKQDINQIYPSFKWQQIAQSGTHKKKFGFSLNLSTLSEAHQSTIRSNVDKIAYTITALDNLSMSDITRTGARIHIKKKLTVDYTPELEKGFSFTFPQPGTVVLSNLSAGYNHTLRTFSFDPVLQLYTVYYWAEGSQSFGRGDTRYEGLMKWGWTSTTLPDSYEVVNATVYLFEDCTTGLCPAPPDNDINLTRLPNQSITQSSTDTDTWDAYQRVNRTIDTVYNTTWGTTLSNGALHLINMTYFVLEQRKNKSERNLTFMWQDPDKPVNNVGTLSQNPTTIILGGSGGFYNYRMPNHPNLTTDPYMLIYYLAAELIPPNITQLQPTHQSVALPEISVNYSCQVNDTSHLENVSLISNFNGTYKIWYLNNTPGTSSINTYNWSRNFTTAWHPFNKTSSINVFSGQDFTTNGTYYIKTDYNANKLRWYNTTFKNFQNWTAPTEWTSMITTNGTHIITLDAISKELNVSDYSENWNTGCKISWLDGNALGMDMTSTGDIWIITSTQHLQRTNTNCDQLSGNYTPSGSWNFESLVASQDTVYIEHKTAGYEILAVFNNTLKKNIYNISIIEMIGGTTTIDNRGLAKMNLSGNLTHIIFDYPSDPVGMHTVYRNLKGTFMWSCRACDHWGNCNQTNNYTLYLGNITIPPPGVLPSTNDFIIRWMQTKRTKYQKAGWIMFGFMIILMAWMVITQKNKSNRQEEEHGELEQENHKDTTQNT